MNRRLVANEYCTHCDVNIACDALDPDAWPYWSYHFTGMYRGEEVHWFHACCEGCANFDQALLEAREDNRRFSEIRCGYRCECGRTLNTNLSERCVMCWRESRMLDKTRRAIKLAARMCRELRRTATERIKEAA